MADDLHPRDYILSLERGFAVIRAFGFGKSHMTLSEVASEAGLTRAAARRFLLTLKKLGHVGSDGKLFWLRPLILTLGYRYLSGLPWWQVAQPIIEDLSQNLQESCNACVLDGWEIVYVSRVIVHRIVSTNVSVGTRLPAYATAMGRVLLSQLKLEDVATLLRDRSLAKLTEATVVSRKKLIQIVRQTKELGYCLVDQELELGLLSLAVPIRDQTGKCFAALGTSVNVNRVSRDVMLDKHLPRLLEASARIAQALPMVG